MLQIITTTVTPRLKYICEFLFGEVLGINTVFTDSPSPTLPCLYYTNTPRSDVFCIKSKAILFENDIQAVYLNEKTGFLSYNPADFEPYFDSVFTHQYAEDDFWYNEIPVLFSTKNADCALGFDILAASFYLLSRYEEYIIADRDAHGRFDARYSIALRGGFLSLPIIEYWAVFLQQKLSMAFPALVFNKRKGCVLPTFDIDMAWAFRHKTPLQHFGGMATDVLKLNFKRLKYRFEVLRKREKDPFFTFTHIENILAKAKAINQANGINAENEFASIFFLMGKYGEYDKNTPVDTPEFLTLIQDLSAKYKVGIHPSYRSNTEKGRLATEIACLAKASKKNITHSRQHFLKLSLPNTYHNLIKNGISHDYSMGYAEWWGFRAGTSLPFFWFDLSQNGATDLRVVPFCVMDVTLRSYLQLSPAEGQAAARELVKNTLAVGGQAVLLWHNSSLSDWEEWSGWQQVLDGILGRD
jgi:hypothetical protein